jgi:hypothetical protein
MFEKILIANRGDQRLQGRAAAKCFSTQPNCVVAASHQAIETRS